MIANGPGSDGTGAVFFCVRFRATKKRPYGPWLKSALLRHFFNILTRQQYKHEAPASES